MIFLWLVVLYISFFYILEFFNRRKSPPGPWPIPLFGNIFQIARASKVPILALSELAKTYGNIFKIRIGFKDLTVLASHEVITEVYSREEAFGRDVTGMFADRNFNKKTLGIGFAEGDSWREKRGWAIKHLKNYGFNNKTSMEYICAEEVGKVINKLEMNLKDGENIIQISKFFSFSMFKIMFTMIKGTDCDKYDDVMRKLVSASNDIMDTSSFGTGIINAYPFLRYIFPKWTHYDLWITFNELSRQVSKDLLHEVLDDLKGKPNVAANNFIEAYALKMQDPVSSKCFHEQDFTLVFLDLVQAASDTTSSFLEGSILFMVLYPDVQTKVYQEICKFIPKDQEPQFETLKQMIYTQAFMAEVHRHQKVVPALATRRITKDFTYKGYQFKKDDVVMADLHSAYNDEQLWVQPELFNPERFINQNGELINQHLVIPFSIGKRDCPGKRLAEVEAFTFLISILRKYQLSVVPGEERPKQEFEFSMSCRPCPFRIAIQKRS